jgi:transposase
LDNLKRDKFVLNEEVVEMSNRKWSSEEKIRIVIEGLTTQISVSELCRRHNVNHAQYYAWRDKFLDGGKRALSTRNLTCDDSVSEENRELKQLVAELTIANSAFKKTLMFESRGRR